VSSYRFGFNGMEKDDELKGAGNSINYEFRFHDSRIGRFMSVDDLTSSYPWYSPYQFAGNKPIWAIDLDGLEEYVMHYRFEDGKVTHLKTIKNSEVTMKLSGYKRVRGAEVPQYRANYTDTRTGQPMSPSEIGKVQYQYYDAEGNRLNIRRDFDGKIVDGDNELMDCGNNNLDGSIYIGPFNPTVVVDGKERGDYRREPQDEVDQAAMIHDMLYDAVDAAGIKGAVTDQKTIPADKVLVTLADNTKKKAATNQPDNVTGKPITDSTLRRAQAVSMFFKLILLNKDN
jgi:RHS repeat-associated protein